MHASRTSRFLSTTAILAVLAATSACSDMQTAWDDMVGNDTTTQKVEVKSPAAAPVQDVKTTEIDANKPVELGSISDKGAPTGGSAADLTAPPANVATSAPAPEAAITPVPSPAPAAAPAPAPVAANSVALLTIRFNQPHVYYEDALTQAVQAAEKAKPGIQYDVLSTVPDLTSLPADQQEKLAARAKDNLRNVVTRMQAVGVSADRIRIAEQTLKIRSQEIQLFVR